jgi:hypothetical protein
VPRAAVGDSASLSLSADDQPLMERYVWELACFGCGNEPEWNLVTWAIDDVAVRFQRFSSECQARVAFMAASIRAHAPRQHPAR